MMRIIMIVLLLVCAMVAHAGQVQAGPASNPFLIFWMIGPAAILVVVWRVRKGDFDTIITALAAALAATAAVAAAAPAAATATATAAVAVAAAALAVDFKSKIGVYIASAIYFLAMTAALVLNYGWM